MKVTFEFEPGVERVFIVDEKVAQHIKQGAKVRIEIKHPDHGELCHITLHTGEVGNYGN